MAKSFQGNDDEVYAVPSLQFDESKGPLKLSWDNLETLVKGVSSIDHHQLGVHSLEEAESYLLYYGYDWRQPADRKELLETREEAIAFIEEKLLDTTIPWSWMESDAVSADLKVPESIKSIDDMRQLLIMASQPDKSQLDVAWACALVKVMHTICHINNTLLYRYYDQAKQQIEANYKQVISKHPDGDYILGRAKGLQLKLAGFDVKDKKSRDSMILKLLCKRETVAEQLFDLVGLRLITYTAADAMLALEILRQNNVLIFANIIPSRTRNTLVDFDAYQQLVEPILEQYNRNERPLSDVLDQLHQVIAETLVPEPQKPFNPENVSSMEGYRAIHITERQLIRLETPETFAGEVPITKFFFPYELQIVDVDSHQQNLLGTSAHAQYKIRKLNQARRRVLGPLLIHCYASELSAEDAVSLASY